ncbi:MAG: glucuronyl hydrolase [Bacteroidota bacterium]
MIRKCTRLSIVLLVAFLYPACNKEKSILTADEKQFILDQYSNTLNVSNDLTKVPRRIDEKGDLVFTSIYGWTSGFFAGNLWYIYELTCDDQWKEEAMKWTEALDTIQYWGGNHDVGFMINCSYGNGLRLTGNEAYKKVLIRTAESLIKRYNPAAESLESWDFREAWDGSTVWYFPVIIDNMMNLELLFEASRLSGEKRYEEIAIMHAQTTMKNHYRDDYSPYHVVDYDTITGEVLDRATCQGFVDESSWARGQAWGLYGFVTCYRYTRNTEYLKFAEHIADYIIDHPNMPEEMVPYWDYNVVDPGLKPEWDYDPSKFDEIPRDASAAAITSSALFELSKYSEINNKDKYFEVAVKILNSLASPRYLALEGKNRYFILNHSVGSIPHGVEIDVPLVYADYYFLEAFLRYSKPD